MLPLSFYIGQWKWLPSPPTDANMRGKTVIVTGSNQGVGSATALQLAGFSLSHLILAVRNLASGAEALQKILKQYPHLRVDVWELDLSSFASVKAFSTRIYKELDKVDILVDNAGQDPGNAVKPMNLTQDGHEQTAKDSVEYWSNCGPEGSPSTFLRTGTVFKATEQFWNEST